MSVQHCLLAPTELAQFLSTSPEEQQLFLLPFPTMKTFCPDQTVSGDIRLHGDFQPQHGCLASAPYTVPSTSTTGAVATNSYNNSKRKRRPAGTPDPDAEVVSLSPKTLMESDRYVCEICNQGFQRDQNLQMHRRRHKVPWKLLKRSSTEIRKRVYVCPEPSCLHHNPCHALGDLVGIKKHYRRKHSTDKQWKCEKCGKGYAVQSDYKAHLKTCGTRGHSCDCGHVFSRVESFIEHQDNCSVAKEKAAMGSSDQTSFASLSTRNGSPSRSADNISAPTWSGISSSGIIRSLNSRHEAGLLIDQSELQLLSSTPPAQNSVSDCATRLSELFPDGSRRALLADASTVPRESRYVQDFGRELTEQHRLQLSIGLPLPEKSNYDSTPCSELVIEDNLDVSYKNSRASSSNLSVPKIMQKSTEGTFKDDHHLFTLSCALPKESEQRRSVLKVNRQERNLEPKQHHHDEELKSVTSLNLIGPRTFCNEAGYVQKDHGESGQQPADQSFQKFLSSRQVNLSPHVESAMLEPSGQGGFDILNFRPSKQCEMHEEAELEVDLRSIEPDLLHNPALKQNEASIAPSARSQSWNHVSTEISTSLSDFPSSRRTKEQVGQQWEKINNDLARAEFLQQQAREELRLAEQAREMARRQLELAEAELADAKRVREHAQTELANAQVLREQAMRRIDANRLETTCNVCRQQFQYQPLPCSTSSAAAPVVWIQPLLAAHKQHLISCESQKHDNEHLSSTGRRKSS